MKKETESAKRNSKKSPVKQGRKESGKLRAGNPAYNELNDAWFDAMQLLEPATSKAAALITVMEETLCAAAHNSDDKILTRTANGLSWIGSDVIKNLEAAFQKFQALRNQWAAGAGS